ncbi:hypothetical protein PINS_up001457 [Pythium insidiosum]|nr:hypothetical protein PINS_up001457 [Pythium insidiosum]
MMTMSTTLGSGAVHRNSRIEAEAEAETEGGAVEAETETRGAAAAAPFRDETARHHARGPRRRRTMRAAVATTQRRPSCWHAKEYDPIQIGSIDGTDTTPHDRALTRALHARFDASADPQIEGDPYATLFVGRLNYATTEETLREVFTAYGAIKRLRLVRDVVTQRSKGYAFVEFEREQDFRRAYERAHHQVIDGHSVLVDFERSRVMPGWKPRRLGGGLGGKKESGQLRFGGRELPFRPPRS